MYDDVYEDEEKELFQEHAEQHSFLFKFYQLFGVINDILLLPMFATIVIENFDNRKLDNLKTGEDTTNLIFCVFFFIEWLLGLLLADKKIKYLRTPIKLMDLISSIPLGPLVQSARIIRLLRLIKIFRLIARVKKYEGPGKNLLYVITIVFAVTFSSAYTILLVEGNINPHFDDLRDGLWWSFVTITSVGYGDKIPITDAGKLIATALMIVGVGVCGYIAAWLMNVMSIDNENEDTRKLIQIDNEMSKMNENMNNLTQSMKEMTEMVEKLEKRLEKAEK